MKKENKKKCSRAKLIGWQLQASILLLPLAVLAIANMVCENVLTGFESYKKWYFAKGRIVAK